MELRLLAVGDVVGEIGLKFLCKRLRSLKKELDVHFTVVNGENCSGVGVMPDQVQDMFDAGADVVTLGNHTWNRMQIKRRLEEDRYLLRPANYTHLAPGRGYGIYDGPQGLRLGVMNLIGRCEMDSNFDNPFFKADEIIKKTECDLWFVDFHAEATSEKGALGWYLDGKVQALWGTHTHVPTADARVLPKGTGFITDLGMTGPVDSILGMRVEQAVNRFLGGLPQRFEAAEGPCVINGALFTIDTKSRKCVKVERVDVYE